MKKILYFITQSEFGGAQRYVFDLAMNLKNDYQVAVALGEQANNGKLAKILTENNIKYFIIPGLKRNISPLYDFLALFKIVKLIKNYQPDIIHLNSSKISILGSLAGFFISRPGLRVVYTVHGWVFNEPLPAWLKYFYLGAEKFTAKFKHKIICVSESDRQTAIKYKIAPLEKLITIHNGLETKNFFSKEESIARISRITGYELRIAELLIGSIGNLYKTKGFEYLIEAADILINNPPDGEKLPIKFLIIGQGAARKNLENLIIKYKLENNFILAGQIDEAAGLLEAFDIYACSSVKEGLPYSVLEAMASGRPIVATNVGGIPEMIIDPSADLGLATGLLVKPAEAQNLAEKIRELINNKELRVELGKNAKEKVTKEFGLEKMIEETKRVYL